MNRDTGLNKYILFSLMISIFFFIGRHDEISGDTINTPAQKDRPLVIKAMRNDYPFSYFDRNGTPMGFNIDIVKEITKVMNLDITIELNSWNTIRQEITYDRTDVALGATDSSTRGMKALITSPHYTVSYYIFTRKDSDINSLKDLKNKTVIVRDFDIIYDYITAKKLSKKIITTVDWEIALKRLSAGEGDCVIMPVLQGNIITKKLELNNITSKGRSILQEKYYMAVSPGNESLKQTLDDGIRIIYLSGKYSQIYREWFDKDRKKEIFSNSIFRAISILLAVSAVIIIILMVWSRTLKKKVADQTGKLRLELTKKNIIQQKLESTLIEKEKINEKARNAQIEAEKASEAKSRFMAKVSHELRTPLHGIIGITGILSKTEINPEQKELIRIIESSAKSLFRIIIDLLDLSRILAGKMKIEKSFFSIEELQKIIIPIMEFTAEEKGLRFTSEIRNENMVIYSDKERISQIIYNLLTNSIKYTEEGSVHILIEQSDALKIQVTDTGIGIPEEMQEKIFESFMQVSTHTIAQDRSLGLGLPIVKELVSLLEGKIELFSKPGEGSTFTITIPIEVFNDRCELKDRPKVRSIQDSNEFENINILVADDESVNRLLLKKSLEKLNWEVDLTESGTEAVEKFKIKKYDIILMDITMPDISGFEATEIIRDFERKEKMSQVPIIALTAHQEESVTAKCSQSGMNSCITKPFAITELIEEINSTLKNQERPALP